MSSPNVCRVVALPTQAAAEKNPPIGPEDVKNYVRQGARKDGYTRLLPNNDWGYGNVDVMESVNIYGKNIEQCRNSNRIANAISIILSNFEYY